MFSSLPYYRSLLALALFVILISCSDSNGIIEQELDENTIVGKYGQLSLNGNNIVDKNGSAIALRGMSLFWSQLAPSYYNEETIKWLRDDWKCTVIRVAMGVEYGGYLDNSEMEYWKVVSAIDACINLGIYVIVDWHDHNAEDHLEEAKEFFKDISQKYGNRENIIYEIYNEPLDVSWTNTLKPYSEAIISEIRKNDPDNLIIAGTPNWSQDVEVVIGNQIDDDNIAYSLHFYTGTHRQWLRDKSDKALNAGIPIYVSEWGLSESDGDGIIDINETNRWTDYLEDNNLSWCNWS
ncbi:MAG: glycoside hydrolase family 5 protein, partial [Melioribacteraceae bacterium]|nr:glycoside hydrolase family 5 protein [Melioribacteraceae bacterium]